METSTTHKLLVERPRNLYYFTDEWYENPIAVPFALSNGIVDQAARYITRHFDGIGGFMLHDGEISTFFYKLPEEGFVNECYTSQISYQINQTRMMEFTRPCVITNSIESLKSTLTLCEKNLLYCFPRFQESLKRLTLSRIENHEEGILEIQHGLVSTVLPKGVFALKGIPLIDQVRACAKVAGLTESGMLKELLRCTDSVHVKRINDLFSAK